MDISITISGAFARNRPIIFYKELLQPNLDFLLWGIFYVRTNHEI